MQVDALESEFVFVANVEQPDHPRIVDALQANNCFGYVEKIQKGGPAHRFTLTIVCSNRGYRELYLVDGWRVRVSA